MRRVLGVIDNISDWSGKSVGMLILAMISILIFEVVMRYAFNAPTIWAHETSQYLFAAYSVLTGAYVLLNSAHIKVDIIYASLSPRVKAILDSVTYMLFFLFVGSMLVEGWQAAWLSVRIHEVSQTLFRPVMFPVKMSIPVGAFLILLQGLAHWIRALSLAITGRKLA